MYTSTHPKKVADGWVYYIVNENNESDPDCRCWSKNKPNMAKIKQDMCRINGGGKAYYDRNVKSGVTAEATKKIIDYMDKTPRTIPQIIEALGLSEHMTRRIVLRLADKGTFKVHPGQACGAKAYTL